MPCTCLHNSHELASKEIFIKEKVLSHLWLLADSGLRLYPYQVSAMETNYHHMVATGTRGSKQRTQQWACSERRVCFKHCTHIWKVSHRREAHRDSTRMLLQINNPEKSTFHFVPKAETLSGWSVLAFHIIANHFQNVCGGVCVHARRYIPTYRCARAEEGAVWPALLLLAFS